jgi:hypothetical protein
VQAFAAAAAAVAGVGVMCPALGVRALYQAYSVMMHAADVWATAASGYRGELTGALRRACCRVLHIPYTRAAAAFVLAELGIIPPSVMLFTSVMTHLAECQVLPLSREMRRMFEVSLSVMQDAREEGGEAAPEGTWAVQAAGVCAVTGMTALMEQPDAWLAQHAHLPGQGAMQVVWPGRATMGEPAVQARWVRAARAAAKLQVRAWGVRQWRVEVSQHPSLAGYHALHPTPTFALYLKLATAMPAATRLRCKLRGGLYPLAAVIRRHADSGGGGGGGAAGALPSAACPLCGAAAETAAHVVVQCPSLAAARGNLRAAMVAAAPASAALAAVLAEAQQQGAAAVVEVTRVLALGGAPRSRVGHSITPSDLLAVYRMAGKVLLRVTEERLRQLDGGAVPAADRPHWLKYSVYSARPAMRAQARGGRADDGGGDGGAPPG